MYVIAMPIDVDLHLGIVFGNLLGSHPFFRLLFCSSRRLFFLMPAVFEYCLACFPRYAQYFTNALTYPARFSFQIVLSSRSHSSQTLLLFLVCFLVTPIDFGDLPQSFAGSGRIGAKATGKNHMVGKLIIPSSLRGP